MTTKTRPSIDLDGTTYTARPYTNALRSKLGEEIEDRQRARSKATRLNLVVQTLQQNSAAGELIGDDVADKVTDAFDEIDRLQRQLDDSALKIARQVLAGDDGKAPTQALIDEHADIDDLSKVIAIALREQEPEEPEESPTPAEPAAS